jgi:hypothetical protein
LWPGGVGAQAQDPLSAGPQFTVDQVRRTFNGAGYHVDQAYIWAWTVPPVTSFQVRDLSNDRVLMVMVYPSASAAATARAEAESRDQDASQAASPHLVSGYGASAWNGNVALVESTESQLQRLYQMQADRDNGVYVDRPIQVADPSAPTTAVDLDFLQALNNGAANL